MSLLSELRAIEKQAAEDLGRYIPADSPHQVVKLIETTAGEPSHKPTGPGYHHDKSDRLVLESKEDMERRG